MIRRIDSKTAQSMMSLEPVSTPKVHVLGPDDIVLSPLSAGRSRPSIGSLRVQGDDRESLIKKTVNGEGMSQVSLN